MNCTERDYIISMKVPYVSSKIQAQLLDSKCTTRKRLEDFTKIFFTKIIDLNIQYAQERDIPQPDPLREEKEKFTEICPRLNNFVRRINNFLEEGDLEETKQKRKARFYVAQCERILTSQKSKLYQLLKSFGLKYNEALSKQ